MGYSILLYQTITSLWIPTFKWYNIPVELLNDQIFEVDINQPILTGFVNTAYANKLKKQCSTTGLVFTFCSGAVLYKSKTQSLSTGSSTEAEFIAAHVAAKITKYLQMVLKQLEYEQISPTPIHIDNLYVLQIINNNTLPTERTQRMNIRYFAI